mgnify:CR=1 FL=1
MKQKESANDDYNEGEVSSCEIGLLGVIEDRYADVEILMKRGRTENNVAAEHFSQSEKVLGKRLISRVSTRC